MVLALEFEFVKALSWAFTEKKSEDRVTSFFSACSKHSCGLAKWRKLSCNLLLFLESFSFLHQLR